ncbi:hypothetical protein L6164_036946 [Bauhinia variegata]|uniref:Uncharacterized protein n=1 Tax=Bauhinia variegata TaxID=167791 RepID=A0ACB9KIQ9_BAUVA|nr:hypothetical protein L6164_036946 [Bauhinia variegata]
MGELIQLNKLSLCNNSFTSSIPPSLSNLSQLETLNLSFNFIQGNVFTQLGRLANLKVLDLAHNQLSGRIPPTVFNLSTLQVMYFGNNFFSGSIPSSLSNMPMLQEIQLFSNNLSGSLPSDMCHNLPNLESVDLSGNALSGRIPPSLHQCKGLKYLTLTSNKLDGYLPTEFGKLPMIEELEFSNNNLTGPLLPLFNLSTLRMANLRYNNFDGELPQEICDKAHSLQHISILNNDVEGSIPRPLQPCAVGAKKNKTTRKLLLGLALPLIVISILVGFAALLLSRRKYHEGPDPAMDLQLPMRIPYGELLEATQRFDERNLLGRGAFGSVYKEFGSKGIVSVKGDVYSYGVMLMEVFTKKKPTDEMFVEGLSLKPWIQEAMAGEIVHVLDPDLLKGSERHVLFSKEFSLSNMVELALSCCADSPEKRPTMKDVLYALNKIRTSFLQMVVGSPDSSFIENNNIV